MIDTTMIKDKLLLFDNQARCITICHKQGDKLSNIFGYASVKDNYIINIHYI